MYLYIYIDNYIEILFSAWFAGFCSWSTNRNFHDLNLKVPSFSPKSPDQKGPDRKPDRGRQSVIHMAKKYQHLQKEPCCKVEFRWRSLAMKDGNVTKYESKLLQTLEIFLPTTNCKPSNEGIVNPISQKKTSKYLQQKPKNGFVFIWVFPKILGFYHPNHPFH